jgi:hypothetical protein
LTKCRTGELWVLVDYEIVVTTDREVPSCWGEFDVLSVGLAPSKFFDGWLDGLSVLEFSLVELQIEGLDLSLIDHDYLSVDVAHQWDLVTYLDHHCGLIESNCYVV